MDSACESAPRVGGGLRFNARPHWGCFGFCNGPLSSHPHWGCFGYCAGALVRPNWGCYGYCPGYGGYFYPPIYPSLGYSPYMLPEDYAAQEPDIPVSPLPQTAPPPAPQNTEPSYEGKSIDEWVKDLKSNDARVRGEAAAMLGRIGAPAKPAIPALIETFKDADPMVRVEAALGAGRNRQRRDPHARQGPG